MSKFRLLSYARPDGSSRAGLLVEDRVFDLAMALEAAGLRCNFQSSSVFSVLNAWDLAHPQIDNVVSKIIAGPIDFWGPLGQPLKKVKLLAPVLYPGVLYCAGANYRDHVIEMTGKEPAKNYKEPFFFLKTVAGTIIGPDQEIRLPPYSSKVDWEAEIAMVIGRAAKKVPVDRAMDHIAGFTIMNDLSARDLSKRDDVPFVFDWIGQKCFDTAAPMGPWITPSDAIADPDNMDIKLWVNDELKQNSNSRQMIFKFNEQIAYLSSRVTLNPGDIIATGTPAGCGMSRGVFLEPGDQIRIVVSGLGELRNPVVAE
ncbi:MAG TPA: fumarylacetoacetate hydrolase family protein [Desulfatiglandales bacterium]|nr:fumarylacetoacetate hydrolase family protein [Desulfatiglandales bacterium]